MSGHTSGHTTGHTTGHTSGSGETDWQRRRRLAEVFGDTLPDVTSDEREPGDRSEGGEPGESASERWLKSQVPPHHG